MSDVAIIGAGPAGTRAAEVLVRAGLRPVVIDEAPDNGGRIYQRPPGGFTRSAKTLYGFEAAKARALHAAFDALRPHVDFRPDTLVWNIRPHRLFTMRAGDTGEIPFDQALLCTGAMDRVIPLPGWTLPGVTSLGGSQVALKAQGCAIGRRVAFLGTGPLLWLVAYQYAKAGAIVAAVIDTTPFATKLRATPALLRGRATFAKGLYYIAWLRAHRVPILEGATPLAIEGDGAVRALRIRTRRGEQQIACDAVALGWGLKPETQLADLADVPFAFDPAQRGFLPKRDATGATPIPGIFLAGDGAQIGGADVAELAGARSAWAILAARNLPLDHAEIARLDAALARHAAFRVALDRAFPFPASLAVAMPDETVLCRCESITAGEMRAAARADATLPAPEVNRAKALTRIGMGRCQGRLCGPPAAEILAATLACPLESVGRLRGQPPVKPIPVLSRGLEQPR
ncbi:MAG TPA: FAD-dependent oxidoreductase [Acetobacteraceae bacterium]|nr:FAD-dependent oxidoreductase [Acetobacteraceae bacterium]